MAFIEGSAVNVALPAFQLALGASVVGIQWIVNSYTLFLAALILLGGSLGDRFGRRRVFMIGIALFAVSSIACGLSADTRQLIIARAFQGIGGALLTPGSLAIITAAFPQGERGRAIGLWSGFSAITAAIGPVLGGWFVDNLSWRWIFFINVPIAIAVLVLSFRFVPESRDESARGRLDVRGALTGTAALATLTWGALESSNRGFGDPLILASLASGIALAFAFIQTERTSDSPMMPLRLFRSRAFAGANLLTLLLYAALGGALFFFPMNLVQVHGYSATAAGAALLPFILLLSVLSRWSGGLVGRYGARLPLTFGPIVAAAGFALFAVPGTGGSYATTFLPAVAVLGLGMALSVAPLTTTVMNSVPVETAGTASGINNAVSRTAGLFAVAAFGIVMILVFSARLEAELSAVEIPQALRDTILAGKQDLAAIALPADLADGVRAGIRDAVARAFVAGFRIVMLLAAVLAAASGLVAWRMIDTDAETDVRRAGT
jgi:EmrB/QacA subfamily drug resistance transporter